MWAGLLDGTIDFIATDHAAHTLEEKAKGYPNTPSGMPGVETALPVMLTQAVAGKCTIEQVSNWMSTAVAKAYNIPNKGAIAIGYDADLVLVDVENYHQIERQDIVSKCGWSPFEGWNLTGYPVADTKLAMTIQEDDPWIKVLDSLFSEIPIVGMFTGYVFNPSYTLARAGGMNVMKLSKIPGFLSRHFTIQKVDLLDDREEIQAILSILMMIFLERRRG